MRTTIEMKSRHRAALLKLAARRGEKGFSNLVAEAIEAYLRSEKSRFAGRRAALSLVGSLSAADARRLCRSATAIRRTWR